MVKKNLKKEIPINDGNLDSANPADDEKSENGEGESEVQPGDFTSLEDKPEKTVDDTPDEPQIDEIARLTDLWQRERASFMNYRRRVDEEKAEIRKYALHDLACELVNVLDYFDSSFSFAEKLPDDARNVIIGVEYTVEELMRVLSAHGISPIQVKAGDKFNSNLMEVVRREEDPGVESGTIIEIQRRGWLLHDRVLRATQVVVSVAPDDEKKEGGD